MKLGLVKYLNVLPLSYSLNQYELIYDVPSNLSKRFNSGELSSAILPVFEVLQHKELYIIDGLSISSRNESASVLLFFNKDIKEIKTVALDQSSQSSFHLLQLLLADYYQLNCEFIPQNPDNIMANTKQFDAYLLIGNNAIEHRKQKDNFLDLAQLWHEWTELPFVFAVWISKEKNLELKKDLTESRNKGLDNLDQIIKKANYEDKSFLLNYYQSHLHYSLADKEKESILLYQKKLFQKGFIKDKYQLKFY